MIKLMDALPAPPKGSIFYEDEKVYACLASKPLTRGHSIVACKEKVTDLHLLGRVDYEHLMDVVDKVRNALMKTLGVDKVYLMYMDEAKHVHWHLVPRYDEQGFNILAHNPKEITDFGLADEVKRNL